MSVDAPQAVNQAPAAQVRKEINATEPGAQVPEDNVQKSFLARKAEQAKNLARALKAKLATRNVDRELQDLAKGNFDQIDNSKSVLEGFHNPDKPTTYTESESSYTQETVRYKDNKLGLLITGQEGNTLDLGKHKYSPEKQGNAAIITTQTDEQICIITDSTGTHLITNDSETNQPVITDIEDAGSKFAPIEFGKPWMLEGQEIQVKNVLLEYKVDSDKSLKVNQINEDSPFTGFKNILEQRAAQAEAQATGAKSDQEATDSAEPAREPTQDSVGDETQVPPSKQEAFDALYDAFTAGRIPEDDYHKGLEKLKEPSPAETPSPTPDQQQTTVATPEAPTPSAERSADLQSPQASDEQNSEALVDPSTEEAQDKQLSPRERAMRSVKHKLISMGLDLAQDKGKYVLEAVGLNPAAAEGVIAGLTKAGKIASAIHQAIQTTDGETKLTKAQITKIALRTVVEELTNKNKDANTEDANSEKIKLRTKIMEILMAIAESLTIAVVEGAKGEAASLNEIAKDSVKPS